MPTFREIRAQRAAADQEARESIERAAATRKALAMDEAEESHDKQAAAEAAIVEIAAVAKKGIITDIERGVQYTVSAGVIVETKIVDIDDDLDGLVQPIEDVEPAPIEDEPFDTSGIPSDTPSVNVEITS